MSPLMMRLFTLVGIALALASLQMKARAESLGEAETRQVQAVIMAQLQAFAHDDAEAAFATATPAVRKAIGDPSRFLAVVRGSYPMVYRAAGYGFLPPEVSNGEVLQVVTLRDAEEGTWLALFALERQSDGSWRIARCLVAENDWRTT